MSSTADPGPTPFLGGRAHAGQDRRVADAPHQPRTQDYGLEAITVGGEHRHLRLRLGGAVVRWRVRLQRRALVDPDQRLAVHERRLGADVDESPHACAADSGQRVAGAAHVAALELRARAPLPQVRSGVEGDVGAPGALGHRLYVVEVAPHRLGSSVADGLGSTVGPGEGAYGPALGEQPLDQCPADEAGAAGDVRGGHLAASLPSAAINR